MHTKDDEVFNSLSKYLGFEFFYNSNRFKSQILSNYQKSLEILSIDYQTYKSYIPEMLGILEQNNDTSLSYSIFIFFSYYNKIIENKHFESFETSILNQDVTDQTVNKFVNLLEQKVKENDQIRFSHIKFPVDNLNDKDSREIASLIVDSIQVNAETIYWSSEIPEALLIQLAILRNICFKLDNTELFYVTIGNFFDRLNTSDLFQTARDFAEEVVYSGFEDDIAEYGFFNAFRCYSKQGSVHAAILYANLSMHIIAKKKGLILDRYLKDIIWQSIKFFRDAGLYKWAIEIYENIPQHIDFTGYERRSIECSYLTCLLAKKENNLPSKLLDYLHKEREEILKGDVQESTPWLILLYNVKRLYESADFSVNGLGYYVSIFESITPKEVVSRYKNIIEGNSTDAQKELKASLKRLNQTRNISDFLYDNETVLTITSRLIEDSFNKENVESILLGMMVKSDYGLIFKEKQSSEFSPFNLEDEQIEDLNSLYSDEKKFKNKILNDNKTEYIWLAVTEGSVYQLSLFKEEFSFNYLKKWDWNTYHQLTVGEYFTNLAFDETTKDHNGVRQFTYEEFIDQSIEVSKEIRFSNLEVDNTSDTIHIVKDMELAAFPHNLFTNNDNFIHEEKAITNILSTEWYLRNKNSSTIKSNFSKSIWIPIEDNDFTLNHLYGSLEKTLLSEDFKIVKKTDLKLPINSDLNIICSHGSKEIATKQVLFPNNFSFQEPQEIIGKGQILIFFVCHSGSYTVEYFRNNINSIVKSAISYGYKAVIAPFWGLHVNIPKIWLPTFLQSLNEELPIDKALFNANKEVYHKYPTPAAWASMHLYGNPHIKISNQ